MVNRVSVALIIVAVNIFQKNFPAFLARTVGRDISLNKVKRGLKILFLSSCYLILREKRNTTFEVNETFPSLKY